MTSRRFRTVPVWRRSFQSSPGGSPTLRTAGWEARSGQFTLWEWHLRVRDTQRYTSQLRALLTPALRRRLLQAGPPSPPRAAFRVLLVLSPTHRVSGCGGFQTLTGSLCALRCTGPLSAGISGALSPVSSQPPRPLCAAPKAQTWQFQGACPVFSEAGASAAPAGGRAEGAPQGVGICAQSPECRGC